MGKLIDNQGSANGHGHPDHHYVPKSPTEGKVAGVTYHTKPGTVTAKPVPKAPTSTGKK